MLYTFGAGDNQYREAPCSSQNYREWRELISKGKQSNAATRILKLRYVVGFLFVRSTVFTFYLECGERSIWLNIEKMKNFYQQKSKTSVVIFVLVRE